MLDFLIDLDTKILLFLNGIQCAYFDNFMTLYTGRFIWAAMYATMLYALFRRFSWKVALGYTIAIALVIFVSDQLVASVIRPYFERLRPSNPNNPISEFIYIVNGYRGGKYGFPSCHAANSFALAMITSLIFHSRKYTIFIFIWAFINSYTRLYLGVHYPGDLLVGAFIGIFVGWIVYSIAHYIILLISTPTERFSLRRNKMSQHPTNIKIYAGIATCLVIAIVSVFRMI